MMIYYLSFDKMMIYYLSYILCFLIATCIAQNIEKLEREIWKQNSKSKEKNKWVVSI